MKGNARMKTTHIYLIRHGQSEANAAHAFIGQTDLDLTERGHLQAEMAAEYLKDTPVDAIYASDLKRAYHTAVHTAEKRGIPIILERGLREINAGEWENQSFVRLAELYPESYGVKWRTNTGEARCDGGESVAELMERVTATVSRIVRENEGKTVFLFTHATPIRALRTAWEGRSASEMREIPWAANASVSHAVYEDGAFRIVSYGVDDFQGDLAGNLPPKG